MAHENELHLQDRSENIKRWQLAACYGDESPFSTAIISALYDSIMGFLETVLDHAKKCTPRPLYCPSLEKSVVTLFFWGRDHNVSHGGLDAALQFSHRLRDTVLTLLVSLGDLLSVGN